MKDFLTRVAERALGTAPRVDPQATSRYAPARLPLPDAPPLLETSGRTSRPPRTSRVDRFDVEQDSTEKVAAPGIEPARGEDINAADRPRKLDQSRLAQDQPQPVKDSGFAAPERIAEVSAVVAAPPPEPQEIDLSRASSGDVLSVDHRSVAREVSAAEREVQQRSPQSRSPQTAETIIDESNVIAESVERSSQPLVEFAAETTVPAKQPREPQQTARAAVSTSVEQPAALSNRAVESAPQPREHQQITRAAVSPSLARPPATTDRRAYERSEHRERNIQVRIGRVEVHAPPAPVTPVEPPAPPAPKLSLAEFLREHNRRRG